MALSQSFDREVFLPLKDLDPQLAKEALIREARKGLADYLRTQTIKPEVVIMVDGRVSATEDNVSPYGTIEYIIQYMNVIGKYAITTARNISPVQSGKYKKSWFLLYDGAEINENSIPGGARELILTNDQPYARKIERRGARLRDVPPGIVERIRQMVLRKYRNLVTANIAYLSLHGAHILQTPIHRGKRVERELTYPSLIITMN